MRAIGALREDHEFFRWCLQELQNALDHTDARERLLLLSSVLAKRLHRHNRREGRLVVLCGQRLGRFGAGELVRFSIDHDIDRAFLDVLRRGLSDGARFSAATVRPAVQGLIAECREHIHRQEDELYPLLERVMSARLSVFRRQPKVARIPVAAGSYMGQWPVRTELVTGYSSSSHAGGPL
jgi:hemerythrin-like domain-containing protein